MVVPKNFFDWQPLINEVKAYQLESPATACQLPKLSPTETELVRGRDD